MTSYFQDGGHDCRPPLTAAYSSICQLPASLLSACDIIGYVLQFQIHSTLVLVIYSAYFFQGSHLIMHRT